MDKTDERIIIREANEICNKYMPEMIRHHKIGNLIEIIKGEGEHDGCLVQSN